MRLPLKLLIIANIYIWIGFLFNLPFIEKMGEVGLWVTLLSYLLPNTSFQRYFFSEYQDL